MDWIKTINRAITYMEDHLTERIELEDVAKSVNLSAFHFHRAFSMLTEMSPTEYLRKRRLSQAGAYLGRVYLRGPRARRHSEHVGEDL